MAPEVTPAAQPASVLPDRDARAFTVGGVTYTQSDGLLTGRLMIFQRQGLEFGLDMRLRDVQAALATAKAGFNTGKQFDAVVALARLMEGTDYVGANRLRDVELCALFYNAPGEDPATYDFDAMQAKIAAWGAVHGGFFMCAALRLLSEPYAPYALPSPELTEQQQQQPPQPAAA